MCQRGHGLPAEQNIAMTWIGNRQILKYRYVFRDTNMGICKSEKQLENTAGMKKDKQLLVKLIVEL